jgi:hypothetical protein
MSTFIKGEAIVLYIYNPDAGPAAYEPVACLTSNSLSLTRGVLETQTKCDPGVTIKDPGSMSYEISCEGIAIETEAGKQSQDELLGYINITDATTETWRMDDGNGGYYFGTGFFSDLSIDAAAGDEYATFSATINGSGLIVTTDPNA